MGRSRGWALLAIVIIVVATLDAAAQSGDTPGLPGAPPAITPLKCKALLAIRDEVQKHGQAITAANEKKADVRVACRLFRQYIATEAKMLRMLETDGGACGASARIVQQVRDSHAKAQQIGKQVCDAARHGPGPAPILDDRLIPPKPKPVRDPWPVQRSAL